MGMRVNYFRMGVSHHSTVVWPPGLSENWRSFDLARQCLERRYDWVVSFHNSFRIMIIPKVGGQP